MLLVIDGKSIVYRLYYANPGGDLTQAVDDFIAKEIFTVGSVVQAVSRCVVAWEQGKSFRHEEFVAYKANRREIPAGLKNKLGEVFAFLCSSAHEVVMKDGFEGDDILGSLSYWGVLHDKRVALVSSDLDIDQLVGDDVRIHRPWLRESWVDTTSVKESWGIYPHQIPDYLAISGDPSDSIPGVPGVGDKGALELILEHGDLDTILRHECREHDRLEKKVQLNSQLARLCRRLATIRTDALH